MSLWGAQRTLFVERELGKPCYLEEALVRTPSPETCWAVLSCPGSWLCEIAVRENKWLHRGMLSFVHFHNMAFATENGILVSWGMLTQGKTESMPGYCLACLLNGLFWKISIGWKRCGLTIFLTPWWFFTLKPYFWIPASFLTGSFEKQLSPWPTLCPLSVTQEKQMEALDCFAF